MRLPRTVLIGIAVMAAWALVSSVVIHLYSASIKENNLDATESVKKSGKNDTQAQHLLPGTSHEHHDTNNSYSNSSYDAMTIHVPTLQSTLLMPWTQVDVEPNSIMSNDIVSITHYPERILIQLREHARCPTPYLIGRLSGPTLTMIQWKQDPNSTMIEGVYHTPLAGEHYLEIIVLYCHRFENESMDFAQTCVEDPWRNRLTVKGASVKTPVYSNSGNSSHVNILGYWSNNSSLTEALYTRWQPEECAPFGRKNKSNANASTLAVCQEGPTSLKGLEPYRFVWSERPSLNETVKEVICLLGDSHSKNLWAALEYEVLIGKNARAMLRPTRYPSELLTDRHLGRFFRMRPCTKIVVELGQWPASNHSGYPMLVKEYRDAMMAGLIRLKKFKSRGKALPKLYVRSVNLTPLGVIKITCPPSDWRTPAVIEAYNTALEEVCSTLGIQFIDSRYIIGPVWDSPEDWSHYDNRGGLALAEYVAGRVMSDT